MGTSLALLIVDGHPGVRAALARRLQHTPGIGAVVAVGCLGAALHVAAECAPDAVIYDPRTVRGNAAEMIGQLTTGGRAVVVLTSSLLDGEAAVLARAGAAAVLLKGCGIAELVGRIETAVAARIESASS
jgi:DNA-binding NarL/FixJ family response regulator